MNTLRWLFPPRNAEKKEMRGSNEAKQASESIETKEPMESMENKEPKQCDEAMASANLVNKIREEFERFEKTEVENQSLKQQLDGQKTALEKAHNDIERYKATIANHEKTLAAQDETISHISAESTNRKQQVQQLQTAIKRGKKERQDLAQELTSLNAKYTKTEADHNRALSHLNQVLDQSSKNLHMAQEANHDLKFDLELLRCTTKSDLSKENGQISDNSFPAPPFVLVLVDGDAYSWAASNFEKGIRSPGAHVAQEIRHEVQKYLLANEERVSVHSRIVTRVFANFGGKIPPVGAKKAKHSLYAMPNFAKEFTESTPLFDFSDAGDGKERVDEKIKENFHLFISNPSCHTIFFAAAKDNGFARLLEQYACNTSAKSKVVVVYPGYVARELAPLGYTTTEWPTVFKSQMMTVAETRAAEKQQQKAENAKNAFMAGIVAEYSKKITLPSLENMSAGVRYLGTMRSEGGGMEDAVGEVIEEID